MPSKITLPMVQIISDYESGMSCRQLGKKYGVSHATIIRKLRKKGKEIKGAWEITLPISQIISDYESGMSVYGLGKKYGCSHTTILDRLRRNNVVFRGVGGKKEITLPISQIISEYESGMSANSLGKKYGVSHVTIIRRLEKEGAYKKKYARGRDFPMVQIISEYESGMNSVELGKKYGVSYNTILTKLRAEGVEIRFKRKKS